MEKFDSINVVYKGLTYFIHSPFNYSDINWQDKQPIPKEDYNSILLSEYKKYKISLLREHYKANIEKGFSSNSLGTDNFYFSDTNAQLDLLTSLLLVHNSDKKININCLNTVTGLSEMKEHSEQQLLKVIEDLMLFKNSVQSVTNSNCFDVYRATSIAEIDAVGDLT